MLTNKTPWIVLLIVWMAGSTWWHVCKIKQLCADDAPETTLTAPASGFTLADGSRFSVGLPGTVNFAKSGAVPNLTRFDVSLDSVATYLQNNPDRQLILTGYYTASETNPSSFSNLGIARAEAIKASLVQRGVEAGSLLTTGVERADLTFNAAGDSVNAGVNGSFAAMMATVASPDSAVSASLASTSTTVPITATVAAGATEETLAKTQKYESVFTPIDLYFKSGSSDYIRTDETRKFFKEAIQYLRTNKDKDLALTGYTDSEGSEDINLNLSKKRANSLKKRLLLQGVSSSQIESGGKGEADPKASNDTESGRKANRRVTVVVQ
ncbi:MAG: OmpA family protein [Rudanella sp.]|nr:OmpA family protein [Rudanella sp.]